VIASGRKDVVVGQDKRDLNAENDSKRVGEFRKNS
jgi:hypothetical protein